MRTKRKDKAMKTRLAGTGRRTNLMVLGWLAALLWPGLWAALAAGATAFVNVSVIPMDAERVLPGQTVLVEGDRVRALGPAGTIELPAGTTVIEGKGRYLVPGLGEMHGHNPAPGSSEAYVASVYFLFVANGVTTVRSMLGWPGQLELREKVERGEMDGPTLYLAGPSFSGATVKNPPQAEARVREQKEEGWDLLKVHPGLSRASYDAMARTARAEGIPFAGHVPEAVGLVHALEMGQETIDHLDGYIEHFQAQQRPLSEAELEEAVRLTRKFGAWVIPTMRLWETIIGAADLEAMMQYPELRYMPVDEVESWRRSYEQRVQAASHDPARAGQMAENRVRLLRALSQGGAPILFGTDAPQQFSVPGFSVHREIEAMVAAGMTPYQILRSATREVGEYLERHDLFGKVVPGHRADLILLRANPLEEITALSQRVGVMVRGQWWPEERIQERLEAIAAAMD
jgi:imidazolonepropionase-like amidohydrolase